jgi:hypothetical protein
MVYVEQVGVNLQLAGVSGEIKAWYSRTRNIKGRMRSFMTG